MHLIIPQHTNTIIRSIQRNILTSNTQYPLNLNITQTHTINPLLTKSIIRNQRNQTNTRRIRSIHVTKQHNSRRRTNRPTIHNRKRRTTRTQSITIIHEIIKLIQIKTLRNHVKRHSDAVSGDQHLTRLAVETIRKHTHANQTTEDTVRLAHHTDSAHQRHNATTRQPHATRTDRTLPKHILHLKNNLTHRTTRNHTTNHTRGDGMTAIGSLADKGNHHILSPPVHRQPGLHHTHTGQGAHTGTANVLAHNIRRVIR